MKDRDATTFGTILGLVAFVFLAILFASPTSDSSTPVKNLPACIEEDGSTQQECMWDDGSGLIVHNWDYGKHYSTYART